MHNFRRFTLFTKCLKRNGEIGEVAANDLVPVGSKASVSLAERNGPETRENDYGR